MRRNAVLANRDEIKAIAARHGAANICLFGSVARDQAQPTSDIDFLVDMLPNHEPWFPSGLRLDLAEFLGCDVEVVTERMLAPRICASALKEAIRL